jgi:hypothetical protein
MMKHAVAASSVGIITTPNQPMYKRFSVLVMNSQNRSQASALVRLSRVVVMTELVR